MRGLKYVLLKVYFLHEQSHPSRVRGLKFAAVQENVDNTRVAPFTGAWIEIRMERHES